MRRGAARGWSVAWSCGAARGGAVSGDAWRRSAILDAAEGSEPKSAPRSAGALWETADLISPVSVMRSVIYAALKLVTRAIRFRAAQFFW